MEPALAKASVSSISGIGGVIHNVERVSSAIAQAIEEQNSVTIEISRTVEETAQAASEVATQIASVSNEAVETGRRATEIRDGSVEIAGKIDLLRGTLVRVIRTSTNDVDRRIFSRVSFCRPGTLKMQGKSGKVIVRDLSLGGAMIDEALPTAPLNAPVSLVIDGIAVELNGFIARKDGTTTLVRFELPEQAKAVLGGLFPAQQAA